MTEKGLKVGGTKDFYCLDFYSTILEQVRIIPPIRILDRLRRKKKEFPGDIIMASQIPIELPPTARVISIIPIFKYRKVTPKTLHNVQQGVRIYYRLNKGKAKSLLQR